jgi:hypothetical protein
MAGGFEDALKMLRATCHLMVMSRSSMQLPWWWSLLVAQDVPVMSPVIDVVLDVIISLLVGSFFPNAMNFSNFRVIDC